MSRATGSTYTADAVIDALRQRYSSDGVVYPQMRVSQSVRTAAVTHFESWRNAAIAAGLKTRRPSKYADRSCAVSKCRRGYHANGYCSRHYQRVRQYGTTDLTTDMAYSESERFWRHIIVDDVLGGGCWQWRGHHFVNGYGLMHTFRNGRKKTLRAHRFAYEHMVAAIPDGLTIDHLCCNRGCVNPAHLEPVTIGENVRRAVRRRTGQEPTALATLTEGNQRQSD